MSSSITEDNFNTRKKSSQRRKDILEIGKEKKKRIRRTRKYGEGRLTEGTLERMDDCGSFWEFAADETMEKKRTLRTNRCKSRWCPRCAWLQARKDAFKIATLMKWIKEQGEGREKGKEFLFLTLTAPNVKADKLKEAITEYNLNFKKLTKRKEVEGVINGYMRKLEVTYNKEPIITPEMWHGNREKHIKSMRKYFQSLGLHIGDANPNYDTYHPHFHVLVAVNKSYFKSASYITPQTWLSLWRDVMGDTSITQVKAQRVIANSGKEIGEMAKYAAKDEDYTFSQEVFDVFYKALAGRQTATYSGLFAEAHKMYKKGKLNGYKEKDPAAYVYRLLYQWRGTNGGEYLLSDVQELTAEERAELHRKPLEETEVE